MGTMTDKAKSFLFFLFLWLAGITACAALLSVAGCGKGKLRTAKMKKSYAPPGWWLNSVGHAPTVKLEIEYADGTKKTKFKPIGFNASPNFFMIDWIEVYDKGEKP